MKATVFWRSRKDENDRPLAALLLYVEVAALITRYGLRPLVFAGERIVIWLIDVVNASYFVMRLAIALRYRTGRWPRFGRWMTISALLLALLQLIHVWQLETIGLWKGDTSSVRRHRFFAWRSPPPSCTPRRCKRSSISHLPTFTSLSTF
jgi:hypothetical protein